MVERVSLGIGLGHLYSRGGGLSQQFTMSNMFIPHCRTTAVNEVYAISPSRSSRSSSSGSGAVSTASGLAFSAIAMSNAPPRAERKIGGGL